jgi:hypothetical protein
VCLGRVVERHGSATTGWMVPSSINARSGVTHGSSVLRSSQSDSMFSPITAFELDICLIRLNRGIRTAAFAAVIRLRDSPDMTDDAPKAMSRPPGRSRS